MLDSVNWINSNEMNQIDTREPRTKLSNHFCDDSLRTILKNGKEKIEQTPLILNKWPLRLNK